MDKYDPWLVRFVGFSISYGSKWFGGYARDKNSRGELRNYADEGLRNLLKQLPNIKDVVFTNVNYWEISIPENSIVYCDPPYQGTTQYKASTGKFNHDKFWEWVRDLSQQGHQVFVSEYNAPDDFECLWSKEINSSLTRDTGAKKGVEKLFKLKGNS